MMDESTRHWPAEWWCKCRECGHIRRNDNKPHNGSAFCFRCDGWRKHHVLARWGERWAATAMLAAMAQALGLLPHQMRHATELVRIGKARLVRQRDRRRDKP